jgi:ketosteroid isomerase-like protein
MNDDFRHKQGRVAPDSRPDSHDSNLEVIQAALKYWRVQDVEALLSTYADDVVYHVYTFQDATPRFAEFGSKEAVRALLYDVLAAFDYLFYASDLLELRDGVARVQSQFVLRHRLSGESLSGSKRQRIQVANDKIVRIDEYHDIAMVNAFMRLTKSKLGRT